jgi:hypothetical protein
MRLQSTSRSGSPSPRRAEAHFGRERWPAKQFIAIVAAYWHKGTEPEWVADELGTTVAHIEAIYQHVEYTNLHSPQSSCKRPDRSEIGQ